MMDAWREKVREIAQLWIGTPFHDNACLRGAGVDCANFLYGVYWEAGLVEAISIPHYSPQWHLHQQEEKFLEFVSSYGVRTEEPLPGATALFRTYPGKPFSHGAIILDWPQIIHASQPAKIVEFHDVSRSALSRVESIFFEPKGVCA